MAQRDMRVAVVAAVVGGLLGAGGAVAGAAVAYHQSSQQAEQRMVFDRKQKVLADRTEAYTRFQLAAADAYRKLRMAVVCAQSVDERGVAGASYNAKVRADCITYTRDHEGAVTEVIRARSAMEVRGSSDANKSVALIVTDLNLPDTYWTEPPVEDTNFGNDMLAFERLMCSDLELGPHCGTD